MEDGADESSDRLAGLESTTSAFSARSCGGCSRPVVRARAEVRPTAESAGNEASRKPRRTPALSPRRGGGEEPRPLPDEIPLEIKKRPAFLAVREPGLECDRVHSCAWPAPGKEHGSRNRLAEARLVLPDASVVESLDLVDEH